MNRHLRYSILVTVLFFTCSLKEPAAPSWDTQLNIPLIDRIYTVEELIEDEENLSGDQNGLLSFHFEKELDKTFVGDHISLPDFSESFKLGLDAFQIPDLPVQADRYYFYQLSQEAGSKHGTTGTIAPFSFINIPSEEHSTADLHFARLTSGQVRIYVLNGLPVELQNVLLTLQDPITHLLILSTPLIKRIAPLDSVISDVDVAGIDFPPNAHWLISGNSPGSNGQSIPIDKNSRVGLVAELRDAVVSAAEARVPATDIERHEQVALQGIGQNAIEEVTFSSGNIIVTIENQTPFTVPDLSIQLMQLHHISTSEPLQLDFSLLPFSRTDMSVDLTDVAAKMDLPQIGQAQYLQMHIRGKSNDLRDQFVTIDENTYAKIDLEMQNVVLEHFSGRLEEQTIELDSTVEDIEISERIGDLQGVELADARLSVVVYNTIQLPLRFQGSLTGINSTGAAASLAIDQTISPGSGSGETRTLLPEFTPQNSAILNVINIQPTQLAAGGQVVVGDGLTYGRVSKNDYIRGLYILDLPAFASWQERTITGDTTRLFIEPEDYATDENGDEEETTLPADATNHIKSAKLMANVENHLPVGGRVMFHFALDSTKLFVKPDVQLGPVPIQAAPVGLDGKVTAAIAQPVELEISEEDIKIFQNDGDQVKTVYVAQELVLQGTGGKQVKVYVTDYVRVQGLLNLLVYVGDFD